MTEHAASSSDPTGQVNSVLKRIEPFALVALGGVLAILGQCSTAFVETDRARFEASLARRAEAMQFLDTFSSITAARIYSASDYFHAIKGGVDVETLAEKRGAFVDSRKAAILHEGIFIARGHDYFGAEFKDTLYKDLFVALNQMEDSLGSFSVSRSDSDAEAFLKAEHSANLLSGALLGTAARRMEGAEHQPPRIHD